MISFRPLPGHLISKSSSVLHDFKKSGISVSVPFRGISFPNPVLFISQPPGRRGFRPLPGHLISKLISGFNRCIPLLIPFPSPSGASHFQMLFPVCRPIQLICFRPLPGHLISKYRLADCPYKGQPVFPSPSGASHFQIMA